jgi:hypothetical protein
MGASFAIAVSMMGAGFAIGASTMGAGFGTGALAISAGFAVGASEIGRDVGLATGALAINAGFAVGASEIGRDVELATLALGVGFGLGFGFGLRLGLGVGFRVASFGIAPGIGATDTFGADAGATGSLVMRGISNDRVPLAVGLGSAGICFHRGTLVAATALVLGEATTATSTLWTRSVGSDSSKSTSFIDAENSDPVEHVKHKNLHHRFMLCPRRLLRTCAPRSADRRGVRHQHGVGDPTNVDEHFVSLGLLDAYIWLSSPSLRSTLKHRAGHRVRPSGDDPSRLRA